MSPAALACPASLKGVLAAGDAADALCEGLGAGSVALPVADGGEGTLEVLHAALGGDWRTADVVDAFGRPRRARWLSLADGTAALEAAEAIPLDPRRLDALGASSRGLGELIRAVGSPPRLLVGLGGVATTDGGAGLGLESLLAPTEVLCDVRSPLLDAARLFAPQKGASPEQVDGLGARRAGPGRLHRGALGRSVTRPAGSRRPGPRPSRAPRSAPGRRLAACGRTRRAPRRASRARSSRRAGPGPPRAWRRSPRAPCGPLR